MGVFLALNPFLRIEFLGFAVSGFLGFGIWDFLFFAEKFKLRLLLRISCDFPPCVLCVSCCFSGLGLKGFCGVLSDATLGWAECHFQC